MLAATTRREMDLRLEAAAAAEFRQNCAEDEGFKVPRVDWRRTGQRVVTFERVSGLPADEREALIAHGHDPDAILAQAAVVFFNQVFRDGFFHADMHPGNMLIDAEGRIVALDFGIMGRIDLAMRRHLAEILVGFLSRDYARVAAVFFTRRLRARAPGPGGVPAGLPGDRRADPRPAAQRDLDRPAARPAADRGRAVRDGAAAAAGPAAEDHGGLRGRRPRRLNPNVNIWQVAQPLVEGWIRDNLGPEAQVRRAVGEGLAMLQALPTLVARVERLALDLERAEEQPRRERDIRAGLALALGRGGIRGRALLATAL